MYKRQEEKQGVQKNDVQPYFFIQLKLGITVEPGDFPVRGDS